MSVSEVRALQERAGADFVCFGPDEQRGAEVVETFGHFPAEYAAIRQRVAVMHMAQRGLIRVSGADRADFLHRMITNDVNGLAAGAGRRAFMLNAKGRIVADLVVLQAEDQTLLQLDRMDVGPLLELLEARLFAEDVQLEDLSEVTEHLALHGPAAVRLARQALGAEAAGLGELEHRSVQRGGQTVRVFRRDEAGSVGLHLLVPGEIAGAIYAQLLDEAGFDPSRDAEPDASYAQDRRQSLRGRPVGWLAYNTARIEAGTPLFHIDFGTDSLPAETGILDQAVSFEKGCYLGQEIVARMKSLGHPKRVLVGLAFESDALPMAGAQVFDLPDADHPHASFGGQVIGGVTSSTLSPLRSNQAIALAVMKWGKHAVGTQVRVAAEGEQVAATVHPLGFLDRG